MLAEIRFFERPCPAGHIYPCSLEDVKYHLSLLPAEDLAGLWAAGLIPSTRKDGESDGRYYFLPKPVIHLFSYPESLRFKLRAGIRQSEIERELAVQLRYGMEIEQAGSHYTCVWSVESLRCFLLHHVLLHEVGHHVFFQRRKQQGYPYTPSVAGAEQFAEDYALRRKITTEQPKKMDVLQIERKALLVCA